MNINDYQSGIYEQHLEYKAFLPEEVCHEWLIADPQLTDILGRADRALGELNAFSQLIPDIDFFIQMHVAKEATQSSRLEGTQTNIEDAFMEAKDLEPDERDDWSEVQNYIKAINESIKNLDRLPMGTRLLCETHETLMQGVRGKHKQPGEYRRSQNWIGVSLKNAAFVPPHHDHVSRLMGDLEKFLHARDLYVHPLVRIAIAHYQFETIHPFLDGNGRLGRLMISLYLASENLLSQPALYLSDYFERNKTSYVDHLMAVRDGNHLRAWLVFFLHGVEETARASAAVFKSILNMKQRIDTDVMPNFTARRQANAQILMRELYKRPVIDIKHATTVLDSSKNTAAAMINDFITHGVLVEITGQKRNRFFIFEEYIGIFKS